MYRVVRDFADLKDKYYVYRAGDTFPRDGKSVSDDRISELKEKAFIEEIVDERKVDAKPKKSAKSKSKE